MSVKATARDYKAVFGSAAGQRVFVMLRKMFGGPSYVKGDTHDTAFREGRSAVIDHIERQMRQANVTVPDEDESGG